MGPPDRPIGGIGTRGSLVPGGAGAAARADIPLEKY